MMEDMEEKELMNAQQGADPVETPAAAPEADPAAKVAELETQVAQFKDMLLRKAAEFDNYKRRSEEQTAAIIKYANEELIEAFLPVVDDLERSLKHGKDAADAEALRKGNELILQKLVRTLEQQGVKPLTTVGTPFDVNLHDALMQVPRTDLPPHTVIEEVEKGYTMKDRVIRHAKVIVSADAEGKDA